MKNKYLFTSFLPMLATAALLIIAPMAREAFYAATGSHNNIAVKMPGGFKIFHTVHGPQNMDRSAGSPKQTLHYTGGTFPAKYHGGNFAIKQVEASSSLITFQPMTDGKPSGKLEIFADHLALPANGKLNYDLALTQAKDGSMYITDAAGAALYRITYQK